MKAATFYNKLNSVDRCGGLACTLALLPLLLWPGLVRGECCCSASADQSPVSPTNLAMPAANLTHGTQPQTPEPVPQASANCPHCITNLSQPAALTSHCDCATHQLASFISSRADSSSTYFRAVSFPRAFTAVPSAFDRSAPSMASGLSVRLLAPTANQRRAFLCCWLN